MDIASICPFPAANTGHAPPALRPGVRICPPAGEPRPLTNSPPTPHPRTRSQRVHRYRPGACPACGSRNGLSANMPTPWREDWTRPRSAQTLDVSPRPASQDRLLTAHQPHTRAHLVRASTDTGPGHAQPAAPAMDTVPICPLLGAKTGHVPRSAQTLDMPPAGEPRPLTTGRPTPHPCTLGQRVH